MAPRIPKKGGTGWRRPLHREHRNPVLRCSSKCIHTGHKFRGQVGLVKWNVPTDQFDDVIGLVWKHYLSDLQSFCGVLSKNPVCGAYRPDCAGHLVRPTFDKFLGRS